MQILLESDHLIERFKVFTIDNKKLLEKYISSVIFQNEESLDNILALKNF
jgi:hypothetical protein